MLLAQPKERICARLTSGSQRVLAERSADRTASARNAKDLLALSLFEKREEGARDVHYTKKVCGEVVHDLFRRPAESSRSIVNFNKSGSNCDGQKKDLRLRRRIKVPTRNTSIIDQAVERAILEESAGLELLHRRRD